MKQLREAWHAYVELPLLQRLLVSSAMGLLLFGVVASVTAEIAPAIAQIPQSPPARCQNSVGGNNSGPMTNVCPTIINPPPPRLPLTLYQNDREIGTIGSVRPGADAEHLVLDTIHITTGNVDVTAPMGYLDKIIKCPIVTDGRQHDALLLPGRFSCEIIGGS